MKCNYCGNELPKDANYCPYCKAQVLDREEYASSTETTESTTKTEAKTNTADTGLVLGIIAIIFAFFSPIVTIILASIGLGEAQKVSPEKAKTSIMVNRIAFAFAIISIVYSILKTIVVFSYGVFGNII